MIIDVESYMQLKNDQARADARTRATVEAGKVRDQVAALHAVEAALRLRLYCADYQLGEPARIEFTYFEGEGDHGGPAISLSAVNDAQGKVLFDSEDDHYDNESEVTDQLATALAWSPDFFRRGDGGMYSWGLPN